MIKYTFIPGIRLEDDIIIIEASTEGCAGRKYVSVTANIITPKLRSEIIESQREYLEDGEYWRMTVEAGATTLSLEQYNDQFDETELLEMADISLYSKTVIIDNDEYNYIASKL